MLLGDPVLQELNRRTVAERGMTATAVVKRFNVFKQVGAGGCARGIAPAEHPFVLQTVEETLRRCIIPAIALATHRANHAVFSKPVLKRMTRVLAAPVGVVDQPRRRLSAKPRHCQRINHDVSRHSWLDRPADDLAVEQIEHHRQI